MLNTKSLLKQINKIDSNKPVFIAAMSGNKIVDHFGLSESASARLIDKSNNNTVKSLLLTALTPTEQGIGTHFDTRGLKSSVKKCIKSNYNHVHIYIKEFNSSAQLKSVIISENYFFLVVDWLELITTDSECI